MRFNYFLKDQKREENPPYIIPLISSMTMLIADCFHVKFSNSFSFSSILHLFPPFAKRAISFSYETFSSLLSYCLYSSNYLNFLIQMSNTFPSRDSFIYPSLTSCPVFTLLNEFLYFIMSILSIFIKCVILSISA